MTNVVFFGSSNYVIPIIDILKNISDLSLVITTEKNLNDIIPSYCIEKKIPYLLISSFDKTIAHKLSAINVQLGVLADLRLIIPDAIMKLFPKGVLNIHPSLLPKYRGPTPVQTAILNGDKTTGVTLIKLDDKIDHGPILATIEEQILENDTAETLYKRLFEIGAKLLKENLQNYIDGEIKPIEQNDAKASTTKKLVRNDGHVDLSKIKSKEEFTKMVRAYHPWPGVWTRQIINNKSSIIKFLPGEKIQVEGKRPMSYRDFENGYKEGTNITHKVK